MPAEASLAPPEIILADVLRIWPTLFFDLNRARACRGEALPHWDRRVFFPYWLMLATTRRSALPAGLMDILLPMAFHAAAWRQAGRIVSFERDVYEGLAHAGPRKRLPGDILAALPDYSFYAETPGLASQGKKWDGFLASLDEKDGRLMLRFLALEKTAQAECVYFSFGLPLGLASLEQAVELALAETRLFNEAIRDMDSHIGEYASLSLDAGVVGMVELAQYVCAAALGGWKEAGLELHVAPKPCETIL